MVMGILAVAFALITPVLYALIIGDMPQDPSMEALLGGSFTAKAQFFESFSPGNNLGLIVPVLLAIVLCKDFSFGTVRNKIISGKSRSAIFVSMYTVCATALWTVMLIHALITLGFSLLFFEFQTDPFTMADVGYLLLSLLFELLIYLFIAAFLCWLCVLMRNVGLAIVLYVAAIMGLSMIAALLQVLGMALQMDGGNETAVKILEFFNRINVCNSYMVIGKGETYSLSDVLYLVLPPLVGAVGFFGAGLLKFKRKDIK